MESYPLWLPDSQSLIFFDQAVSDNGKFRGQFVVHRHAPGTWGTPRGLGLDGGGFSVLSDGNLAYVRAGGVEIGTLDHDVRRVIYQPAPQSADPFVESVQAAPGDGHTLY